MRNNKIGGKNLKRQSEKSSGEVFVVYEVKGLNLDRFLNALKSRDIELYDVRKISNKYMLVTVSLLKSQKFFAFARELCYNVKKLREKGRAYPLILIKRNIGILLGIIFFIVSAVIANDFVFQIDYSGSGSVYKSEVSEYLESVGVRQFSRFSDINRRNLGDNILANNSHLSFVSCWKNGNHLHIDMALSKDKVEILNDHIYELNSPVCGVVESVRVYRGTSLVSVGDCVENGDLLVKGEMVMKEQVVKINVLASLSIKCQDTFIYTSDKDGEEDYALLLAEQILPYRDITDKVLKKDKIGEKFVYTVNVTYRVVVSS